MSNRTFSALAATVLAALTGIAAQGRNNEALADDGLCFGNAGNLCRTVAVQICQEWTMNNITFSVTGGGGGTTCAFWMTTTYYYYYDSVSSPGVTGLKK